MRLRQPLSVLLVVALAGALSVTGCASTSTKRTAAGSATAVATSGGAVHLTDYTDNDGPLSTVILAGAVGDFGQAQRVNPDGSVNTKHDGELKLTLTHGSFRLDMGDLDTRFIGVLKGLAVNASTCSATASVSGTVPITAGSGTGSYSGISGTFHLTITLDEVYKPNQCRETGAYLAQSIVTAGPGTISLR